MRIAGGAAILILCASCSHMEPGGTLNLSGHRYYCGAEWAAPEVGSNHQATKPVQIERWSIGTSREHVAYENTQDLHYDSVANARQTLALEWHYVPATPDDVLEIQICIKDQWSAVGHAGPNSHGCSFPLRGKIDGCRVVVKTGSGKEATSRTLLLKWK